MLPNVPYFRPEMPHCDDPKPVEATVKWSLRSSVQAAAGNDCDCHQWSTWHPIWEISSHSHHHWRGTNRLLRWQWGRVNISLRGVSGHILYMYGFFINLLIDVFKYKIYEHHLHTKLYLHVEF